MMNKYILKNRNKAINFLVKTFGFIGEKSFFDTHFRDSSKFYVPSN